MQVAVRSLLCQQIEKGVYPRGLSYRQEVVAVMGRLDSYQERPGDRGDLVDLLALAVLYSRLCSDEAPFDRKTMRLVLDIHQRVSSRSPKTRVDLLVG